MDDTNSYPTKPEKIFIKPPIDKAVHETDARIVIDRKLRESGWTLEGPNKNVLTEQHSQAGHSGGVSL